VNYQLLQGDNRQVMRTLPAKSVHCVVTSPPYAGLRDYGVDGQIGLEPEPDCLAWARKEPPCGVCYVCALRSVFAEVWRVLRDDGVCWLNLGDSYNGSGGAGGDYGPGGIKEGQPKYPGRKVAGLKPKDLMMIPARVALALQQPYQLPTIVKSETDRAWLAAMFDGEGCIGVRRFDSYRKEKEQVYQDGFVVYTIMTNNDLPLLDRCIEITGYGKVGLKQSANSTDKRGIVSRRDSYGWRLDGNKAVDVIRSIYPYLIAKRKQACIAYTLDRLNKNGHGSRAVPAEIQEKKAYLKELINRCNQRESIDLPSWIEEPKPEIQPGWYLRSDVIWSKPNPMPESVTDRPTKAHEYVFLLAKQQQYFYDAEAVREPFADERMGNPGAYKWSYANDATTGKGIRGSGGPSTKLQSEGWNADGGKSGRNRRSVWSISTKPYHGAHFATMPPDLAEICIKAGSSEHGVCGNCGSPWQRVVERTDQPDISAKGSYFDKGKTGVNDNGRVQAGERYIKQALGFRPTCTCNADIVPATVLDPFGGSGTTAATAVALGRNAISIDLSADYIQLQEERIAAAINDSGRAYVPPTCKPADFADMPLFAEVTG
jgi:DNA modification methylase